MANFARSGNRYDNIINTMSKVRKPEAPAPVVDSETKLLIAELRKTNELMEKMISAPDPLREQLGALLEKLAEPRIVQVTNQVQPTPVDVTVTNEVNPTPVEVNVSNQVQPTPVDVNVKNEVKPTPVSVNNKVDIPAGQDGPPIKLKVIRDVLGKITGIEEV